MNLLSKAGMYLASNLGGVFGQKWVMAIILTIFIGMSGTIYTFQKQKENLRQEITDLTVVVNTNKSEYKSELERINTKHNQIIKDMIAKEELVRIQEKLKIQENTNKIKDQINKKLNEKLRDLESVEFEVCELPEEIKEILNKGKVKK